MRDNVRRPSKAVGICCVLGCLLLLTGCSDKHPATYPVTGEVYHNRQPVADASVVFTSAGPLAKGTTDAAGKFTLRTFADGDGAIAGTHRVTITKNVAQPAAADNPYPMTKNMLPAKYARPDTSALTADVKDTGENSFRFDLVN